MCTLFAQLLANFHRRTFWWERPLPDYRIATRWTRHCLLTPIFQQKISECRILLVFGKRLSGQLCRNIDVKDRQINQSRNRLHRSFALLTEYIGLLIKIIHKENINLYFWNYSKNLLFGLIFKIKVKIHPSAFFRPKPKLKFSFFPHLQSPTIKIHFWPYFGTPKTQTKIYF